MNKRILIILGCILFLAVGFTVGSIFKQNPTAKNEPTNTTPKKTEQASTDASENLPKSLSNDTVKKIQELINEDEGTDYSIYVNTLDGKQPYIYNDQQFRSASMIKVFILAKAMEEIHNGKLDEEKILTLREEDKVGGAGSLVGYPDGAELTVAEVLRLMIIQSDNTATNMMIDLLGMDNINEYIQREGYTQSVLHRKMMDTAAIEDGKRNFTSAKDLGTFFTKLYRHQCISPELDDKMIDLLVQQTDTEGFPTALPNRKIAHKTGELMELYHDGGIIYSSNHNYVLCILSDNIQMRATTLSTMRQITALIDSSINE